MTKTNKKRTIVQLSVGEEIGNSVTHGIMSAFLLCFLPYAAIRAYLQDGATLAVGNSIFVISLFLMFLSSTLYHAMAYDTKHKYVFQLLDHIFIYVAIAGTYTPIALSIIGGWFGLTVLVVQWLMVLFGILYKSISQNTLPKLSVTIYMIMGWTAVILFPKLISNSRGWFVFLIVLGGLLYSIGAWFYMQKNRPYFHMIWHIFINLASLSHFIAIIFLN